MANAIVEGINDGAACWLAYRHTFKMGLVREYHEIHIVPQVGFHAIDGVRFGEDIRFHAFLADEGKRAPTIVIIGSHDGRAISETHLYSGFIVEANVDRTHVVRDHEIPPGFA